MAANFEMPSIDIEPIGSAPALNFDLNAGTVPGGEADEEPWVYQRAGRSNLLDDDDDIWALPAVNPPAIASSSNHLGCFVKTRFYLLLSMSSTLRNTGQRYRLLQ